MVFKRFRKAVSFEGSQERHVKKLQKLRNQRIKAEASAKLKNIEAKERKRIIKARNVHGGGKSFLDRVQDAADKYNNKKPPKTKRTKKKKRTRKATPKAKKTNNFGIPDMFG